MQAASAIFCGHSFKKLTVSWGKTIFDRFHIFLTYQKEKQLQNLKTPTLAIKQNKIKKHLGIGGEEFK